jgi:hypothetical protein
LKIRDRRKVRRWAEFASSLPTDLIEDDHGFVQLGGKSVAAAIGEILKGLGCDVDPPEDAGDNGWDFEVRTGGARFLCQVTHIEDYIFLFEYPSAIARWLGREPPIYFETLGALAAALAEDARFSDVRWVYEPLAEEMGVADPFVDA